MDLVDHAVLIVINRLKQFSELDEELFMFGELEVEDNFLEVSIEQLRAISLLDIDVGLGIFPLEPSVLVDVAIALVQAQGNEITYTFSEDNGVVLIVQFLKNLEPNPVVNLAVLNSL